jgi:nitrite reductase/ring-hydroxylating ferredoxin subunit
MDPDGWADVAADADVPDGRPMRVESPWGRLMLFRHGEDLYAVANACPHQGAPLDRGQVRTTAGVPIVTCAAARPRIRSRPSSFAYRTGAWRSGPGVRSARSPAGCSPSAPRCSPRSRG